MMTSSMSPLPLIDLDSLARALAPARRIYAAGCAGEPTGVLAALGACGALRDKTLTGVFIPGVNRLDLAALDPTLTVESIFVTPALRRGFEAGRVRHLPLAYVDTYHHLQASPIDAALFTVAPPRDGMVSLAMAHDFTPAVAAGRARLYGVILPDLPEPRDGIRIPIDRFSGLIDSDGLPAGLPPDRDDPVQARIGARIAGLIEDGATIQTGIGAAPAALLRALKDHRDLGLHAGMVTAAGLELLEAGVASRGITTGVALGTPDFHQRIARAERVRFRPVAETHDIARLGALPRLVAVNGAIEVDLFGQASAEMIGGRQISGQGGLVDFLRGARRSAGGKAVVALASTAAGGARSRIVPVLESGTVVSIQRADIDIVVTEYGCADLRGCDLDMRAERLIAVAAPEFQGELERAWSRIRRQI
ncbi:MAG: 4-hydroxybutyrate coenzyme A transferase [Tistrella sp.]|nr:4-hydroxybutyrate coenzyme A transferase [Tistrella sp.]MBA77719.1 4-hydroxybutyrate coenzyme A transferase [Tistrella sp.]